jgi:hypothetical protein
MTQDEIIEMAEQAGMLYMDYIRLDSMRQIEAFAKLVAAKAIAELESQKPVAWMFQHDETGRMNYVSNDGTHNPTMFLEMNPRYALVCPLYTTPPQRTWVGLTEAERIDIIDEEITAQSIEHFALAQAIEAKLKEKNT